MPATLVDKPVIAIVCERSVDFDNRVCEDSKLKSMNNVHVIKVPCSGMIQPVMIESALKQGAAGVVTMGCRMGDCHYREGNKFLRERLLGQRMPKLKPSVDKQRVMACWLSAVEYDAFDEAVANFQAELKALESSN